MTSAVGFVSWENSQNGQSSRFRIAPEANTQGTDPQAPLGRLHGLQTHHVAVFVRGVAVDGSDEALADLWVEAIGVFKGTLRPGNTPPHRRPKRRLTSS
jgi:hypothetical protein